MVIRAQTSTTFYKESILHVSHALDARLIYKLLPRPDIQRLVATVAIYCPDEMFWKVFSQQPNSAIKLALPS